MSERYQTVEAILRTADFARANEQASNNHQTDRTNFQFVTRYVPRDFVVIDDEEYPVDQLEDVLESLVESDNAFATTVVPKKIEPLIERHQLGTQRAADGWACHDDKAKDFLEQLQQAYIEWDKQKGE